MGREISKTVSSFGIVNSSLNTLAQKSEYEKTSTASSWTFPKSGQEPLVGQEWHSDLVIVTLVFQASGHNLPRRAAPLSATIYTRWGGEDRDLNMNASWADLGKEIRILQTGIESQLYLSGSTNIFTFPLIPAP